MSNDKKVNILAIVLIMAALLGSLFFPAYKVWFNVLALSGFSITVFYQCYLLYKAGKEWKKYLIMNLMLCIFLGVVLFV